MKYPKRVRTARVIAALIFVVSCVVPASAQQREIGRSVEGRPILVETFGSGPVDLIIVGGIHGGYEANSILLARRFAAHFRQEPQDLAARFTLHIIDNMNPDGLFRVTAGIPAEEFDFESANTPPGRFNANGVDLNRNWDATWRPVSTWRNQDVDAGDAPFSEPETVAVRDYFLEVEPVASVFYQSAGAFLWYSGAEEGWTPSLSLAEVYGSASGYRVVRPPRRDPEEEDDITGSADDWFYKIGHRNITVELTTHYVLEWERNLAGLRALLAEL
jgi:hypothetical protein